MARLQTIGFEIGIAGNAGTVDGQALGNTVPVLDTVVKRTGAKSAKCVGSSTNTSYIRAPAAQSEAELFYRVYLRFTALPTADKRIVRMNDTGAISMVSARLTSAGKLRLWNDVGNAQIGGDSAATLVVDTWYRIELRVKVGAGATDEAELRLDGTTVAAATGLTFGDSNINVVDAGWVDAPGTASTIYLDDLAANTPAGAAQNSWPDSGAVYLCKPISDNQRGTWQGGAGGTTNLWDAVDNTPPAGLATETNTSQIESADTTPDNDTDEYRANLTTYDNAGIPSGDTIKVLQLVINHAEEVATGIKTGRFYHESNPVGTVPSGTFDFGDNVGAMNGWPTNWRTAWGGVPGVEAPKYDPTVTRASSPVVSLRKVDTGNRFAEVDFLGMYVEAQPPAGITVTPGTASLSTATFAPTVSTPRLVTPSTASLTLTAFAPSAIVGVRVTPTTASLATTVFVPSVILGVRVTPTTAALATTTFAPTVSTPRLVTPSTASVTLTTFSPSVTVGVVVTPTTASLSTTTFAPTVSAPRLVTPTTAALTTNTFAPAITVGVSVTPTTASLSTTTFAPTVSTPVVVTPSTLALTTTTFAPTINVGVRVAPTTAALTLTTFAPTVSATAHVVATPTSTALALTTFAPTVTVGGGTTTAGGRARRYPRQVFDLTVSMPITVVVQTARLRLTTFAPTVTVGDDEERLLAGAPADPLAALFGRPTS